MSSTATPAAVRLHFQRVHNSQTLKGIAWRVIQRHDVPAVEHLVRRQVRGADSWSLQPGTHGMAAYSRSGSLVAAVLATRGRSFAEHPNLFLTVAAHPSWGGTGLELAGLILLERFLAQRGFTGGMLFGACSSLDAQHYQQAGYEISRPHEPLRLPGGKIMVSPNPQAPCWFYRRPLAEETTA
ncbi:hypothetical protein NBM05_01310 [Rothia sp. AR01]|uniref:Uncharacterized protein n=1 Tax=Rothia santali TaxID=2949643 RepID=A0A9X2KK63_9MICC|nr:hypothetical protein [Rothia santali]MCP3424706.1 hypothetical protein [Rothia santali]